MTVPPPQIICSVMAPDETVQDGGPNIKSNPSPVILMSFFSTLTFIFWSLFFSCHLSLIP